MHETLVNEWRRAMAARAAIAALLFVIPACVATYVQLGGGAAGLPSGLQSLVAGPSTGSAGDAPAGALRDAVTGIIDLVSGSSSDGGGSSGGQGGSPTGGGTGGESPTDGGTTPPPTSNPPSDGDATGSLGPLLDSLNSLGIPSLQGN